MVTGSDGRFTFPQTSEFEFLLWFGDRVDTWTLCFQFPDGHRASWSGRGYWGGPRWLDVQCVLTASGELSCSSPHRQRRP